MKMILLSALSAILVLSLSGCGQKCPEPEVITKIVEVKQEIPDIQGKPVAQPYDVLMINFDGVDYYAMTLADGAIMASNWTSHENWANTNYKILLKLKED